MQRNKTNPSPVFAWNEKKNDGFTQMTGITFFNNNFCFFLLSWRVFSFFMATCTIFGYRFFFFSLSANFILVIRLWRRYTSTVQYYAIVIRNIRQCPVHNTQHWNSSFVSFIALFWLHFVVAGHHLLCHWKEKKTTVVTTRRKKKHITVLHRGNFFDFSCFSRIEIYT